MLLSLEGFDLLECAQGLLGADSAKRTGLLTLNMPRLPQFIRANALCPHLPKAQTIGVDEYGNFRTPKLKEYPRAFCRAMAEGFLDSFPSRKGKDIQPMPPAFLSRCATMHCTTMGTTIGADYAGHS